MRFNASGFNRFHSAASILLFLHCVSSISLLADPIAVTILNQTLTSAVSTYGISARCSQTGSFSATCSTQESTGNPFVPTAQTFATASASPTNFSVDAAAAGGLPNTLVGYAFANVEDTVLITGGQGLGYLNVVFNYASNGVPGSSVANLAVNGQTTRQVEPLFQRPLWTVASFVFGQPFTFAVQVSVTGDNLDPDPEATLQLVGVHVYASPPSGCLGSPVYNATNGIGFCDDPDFTSANQAFSQLISPEPGTLGLFAVAAFLLFAFPRRRATPLA